MVTATANPVLRYTYGKGYWDAQMQWVIVTAETDIPAAERFDEVSAADPNAADTWNFRITWKQQQLKRTLTMPNTELYWVRGYVIAKPQQAWRDRTFTVLTMARPVVGGVVPGNGYTEAIRHIDFPTRTYGTTTNLDDYIERSTSGDGWHAGTDYAAGAGTVVNTAEWGTVADGAFERWPPGQGGILDAIMDSIIQAINAWMIAHNHPNGDPRDFLRVDVMLPTGSGQWDNRNNLGPNREVNHGKVNLLLKDAAGAAPNTQYDQGTVVTKYCHADWPFPNPPAVDAKVDISTIIDVIGPWKYPQVPADYHDQTFKTALLPRGYFKANGTVIKLFEKATNMLVDSWPTAVAFPSLTGPHLHLEVRIEEKAGTKPNLPGYVGQQDPETWLFLPFGARQ